MNNKIIGNIEYRNAEIKFKGSNNIFICKNKLILENCKIRFTGNNSLVYIDKNNYPISLNIRLGNDSVVYIGKDCYMNRTSHLYATERKNIIIGDQMLLSFDVYMRTADPHLIYDCETKKRINFSKSILIGDRVWIGQQSLILKGVTIGSGAIIGGNSVVSNKKINSNSLYAGNPAKKIKEGVFFGNFRSTHDYTDEEEIDSKIFKNDDINSFVYEKDKNTISLNKIDRDLMEIKASEDKINYLEKNISNNINKNRFYQN